jgi:hypothetical protein
MPGFGLGFSTMSGTGFNKWLDSYPNSENLDPNHWFFYRKVFIGHGQGRKQGRRKINTCSKIKEKYKGFIL